MRGADARRPVRWAPVIGLSLLLLTSGWTLLWLFARSEALSTFDAWRDSERVFGRIWTCPGQRVGGFPLGITLTCDHPTFKGPVADGVFEGGLNQITAATQLYFPTKVVVTLASPLRATEIARRQHIEASWSAAALTLRGPLPGGLDRGMIETSDLRVVDTDQPQDAVEAKRFSLGFRPITRASDVRADLEAVIDADGLRVAALDATLGSTDPLRIRATGFATQVRFDGRATAAEVLGPWSRAGGQVHLQDLDADKGPLRMRASGRFGLDEEHRLEGRLDAGFNGLAPIADRLGLPADLLKVGSAIASLLGNGSNAGATVEGAELSLPITAKNGTVTFGPAKLPIALEPVY